MRTGFLSLLGMLAVLGSAPNASGESLEYHLTGMFDPNAPGTNDGYGLNGAHFDLAIFVADTQMTPEYSGSNAPGCIEARGRCDSNFALHQLPTTLTVSDRPNGLSGYTVGMVSIPNSISDDSARYQFVNSDPLSGFFQYDMWNIDAMQAGPGGLQTGALTVFFPVTFFSTPGAPFIFPVIRSADAIYFKTFDQVWGGHTVSDLSISTVPVPPALWLFGSALSLMGAVRRKVTVQRDA